MKRMKYFLGVAFIVLSLSGCWEGGNWTETKSYNDNNNSVMVSISSNTYEYLQGALEEMQENFPDYHVTRYEVFVWKNKIKFCLEKNNE